MLRTFKDFTIAAGGTPQPLVGTTTSAAMVAGTQVTATVADSSVFQKGDSVIVDIPSSTVEERAHVFSIVDPTHIIVDELKNAHASGIYIRLAQAVQSIYIQTNAGNAGIVYVGTAPTMVKATGVSVVSKLVAVTAGTQETEWSDGRGGPANCDSSGGIWIDGNTGDKYRVTLGIV